MTQVHISGAGIVCSSGVGHAAFVESLRSNVSGVSDLKFDRGTGNRIKIAASLPKDVDLYADEPNARLCDRFSLMALMAAREAVAMSALQSTDLCDPRTAVIIASGIGGMGTIDDNQHAYYKLEKNPDPFAIPKIMPSAAASQVGMALGIKGPSFALSSACSSSTQAIGLSLQLIRAGIVDRVVVGGSEALITPATMRCWEMMRVLTPSSCKPFDTHRNGMVIGEGAAILVIESEESLTKRGARSIGRLLGYGTTSDAGDLVKPDAGGAEEAMRIALADAGLTPSDVGYINAHGTGTVLNDRSEAKAINAVFGPMSGGIAVSSTKPFHGHCLGAAGAIELIAALAAINDGFAPATLNTEVPAADCDLSLVLDKPQDLNGKFALSNNFAFGGINASLVIGRQSLH